jgi:RNA polymerase sigma-70 factor (ECF subfamily)
MGDGCRCAAPAVPRQSPPMSAAACDEPREAVDHLTRLFRLARALCGSRGVAEELTQEAYARVLAPLGAAEPEFTALASALLDVLADEPHRRPFGEPVFLAGEIYAAVAGLPADLREAVALVDVAGMSYAEAARVLRVPQTNVMSQLVRGRTRLARALARAA